MRKPKSRLRLIDDALDEPLSKTPEPVAPPIADGLELVEPVPEILGRVSESVINGDVAAVPNGRLIAHALPARRTNTSQRIPICLILDVSSSMYGDPIEELQKRLGEFKTEVLNDKYLEREIDLSVITFSSNVQIVKQFGPVDGWQIPRLHASGSTALGEAVNVGLDLHDRRAAELNDQGTPLRYRVVVLFTDGQPTDSRSYLECAAQRVRACETPLGADGGFSFFGFGVGDQADLECLAKFSNRSDPMRVQHVNFKKFFAWLLRLVKTISLSRPGELIELPNPFKRQDNPEGFAEDR